MKICFFTENYVKGGLDTFLVNLFNSWPNSTDVLTLMCNNTHPGLWSIENLVKRKLHVVRYERLFTSKLSQGLTELPNWLGYIIHFASRSAFRVLQYPVLLPWYIFGLTILFARSKFDRLVVVNGGYPASLLCRCAMIAWFLSGKRPRAILNVHSLTLTPSLLSRYIENTIDKSVVESSKYVIGVSKSCVESLRNRKNFSNKTNLKYIYNGIVDPTAADVLDDEYLNVSESNNDEYVLMLASYDVYKGFEFLMDAFKIVLLEFPDIKIKIYGYGLPKKKETIREIVSRLELQSSVSLNDFSSDVVKLYAHAKILVVPSQSFESFGLTIIEAMAHGVPVVATDVGGIPEVLYKSYAGFMCSKDDPVSFANAIKKLLRDPSLAKMMGQNGRNTYMQRFTAARMSFEYWTLIKDSEVDIINE